MAWRHITTNSRKTITRASLLICNVGGGDVAIAFYRVTMYAHHVDDVGRFEKTLLHAPEAEEMQLGAS